MARLGFGKFFGGHTLTTEELQSLVQAKRDGWQKTLFEAFEAKESPIRAQAAHLASHLTEETAREPLVLLLRDADQDVIIAALDSIGTLRIESALPAVTGLLGRHERRIKDEVARCLTKIGGAKGAAAITELLDVPRLPQSSQESIGALGVTAIPALMSALMDGRRWVRQNAAVLLGTMGDQRSVASLMVALNDKEPGVRVAAVDALGLLGGKDAAAGLMGALQDNDDRVRMKSAAALGKTGDEKAVVPLISLFADEVRHVRDQAVKALVDLGPVAVPALIRGLRESDSGMREYCAKTLCFIKSHEALEQLLEVLEDNEWCVRRYAAEALGKLGEKSAIPYLLGALKDPIDFVRERAQQAIEAIDPSGELRRRYKPKRRKHWETYDRAKTQEKKKEPAMPSIGGMDLAEAYEVLNLDLGATRSEVRHAWRGLMRCFHPDVVGSLPDAEKMKAEEEAKRVNVAYETLTKAIPK